MMSVDDDVDADDDVNDARIVISNRYYYAVMVFAVAGDIIVSFCCTRFTTSQH